MIETGVVISNGASKDIAALATGQDRVDVALAALKEAIDNGTLTPAQNRALEALASRAEKLRPENQIPCREITLNDGSNAIEMHVPVNGQIIRAVLSDSSFDKSRYGQESYATGLGGRLATKKENVAVVEYLLEKEEKGTLNPAEQKLLNTYLGKFVRDSEGMIGFRGRRFVFGAASVEDDHSPRSGALVILPLAESLLSVLGYKKYEDGSVEITMPKDGNIQELGKASNAEAKAGGMSSPVFCEDQAFWQKNEANPDLQTEPGKTYRFRIPQGSRDRSPDQAEFLFHAPLAPLGAIALAEACERLQTNNEGSLYKIDDRSVWVMGATPGVALLSSVNGVFVSDNHVFSDLSVACAVLVPAPNQTS